MPHTPGAMLLVAEACVSSAVASFKKPPALPGDRFFFCCCFCRFLSCSPIYCSTALAAEGGGCPPPILSPLTNNLQSRRTGREFLLTRMRKTNRQTGRPAAAANFNNRPQPIRRMLHKLARPIRPPRLIFRRRQSTLRYRRLSRRFLHKFLIPINPTTASKLVARR